jgi:hypothetical protein
MEEIDRQRRHAAGREVLSKAGYTNEREILSLLASPQAKKKVANRAAALPAAARAQQPDHVPVRPPQANPAVAARNVQPRTPPRRRDHAFAAIANNQAALPNVLNLPPTPNHRDPQMEQPLQVRQEPEQPIDDNRAANNAAPPQNHWIRTIMFSFVLFMFFIIISLYDRVNVLSAPGKCMHAPLNGGNLELAWCWNVKQNLHYDASTRMHEPQLCCWRCNHSILPWSVIMSAYKNALEVATKSFYFLPCEHNKCKAIATFKLALEKTCSNLIAGDYMLLIPVWLLQLGSSDYVLRVQERIIKASIYFNAARALFCTDHSFFHLMYAL